MRTSQNHSVDVRTSHGFQIILNNFLSHNMILKTFLYQRHKEWACFFYHGHIRRHLMDDLCIHTALHCGVRSHDSHLTVSRRLYGSPCSGYDNAHNRNVKFISDSIKRQRARRIAGDHDGLDILCFQETNNLFRETYDRVLRFASVRNSRRISKINDIFIWELTGNLSCNRQPAHTGIKHTNRCCIPVLHNVLLSPVTWSRFSASLFTEPVS